ncbi:MAG: tyrosine-protein phosphatase [Jatrophihabitans endophyticus]|nr:tyrosine-protein phosphatase [Jatrophihabitans endophyticus]
MWLSLDGAENVRDVGGLPTEDGGAVRPGALLRADSLQQLSESDVRRLVDDLHVTAVADLRTGVEVAGEGPGPLTREPAVDVVHLSLFPESGDNTDAAAVPDSGPVVLPWQQRDTDKAADDGPRPSAAEVYASYLDDRADSILAALRLIASTDGATIVHCAAGKDRTGTVVALALREVGVTREAVVEDYTRSAERVERVFARLARRRTYAGDITGKLEDVAKHKPRAETMSGLLAAVDERHGGVGTWLRAHGWTDDDAAALRRKLRG